jgi:hypothetical protein
LSTCCPSTNLEGQCLDSAGQGSPAIHLGKGDTFWSPFIT